MCWVRYNLYSFCFTLGPHLFLKSNICFVYWTNRNNILYIDLDVLYLEWKISNSMRAKVYHSIPSLCTVINEPERLKIIKIISFAVDTLITFLIAPCSDYQNGMLLSWSLSNSNEMKWNDPCVHIIWLTWNLNPFPSISHCQDHCVAVFFLFYGNAFCALLIRLPKSTDRRTDRSIDRWTKKRRDCCFFSDRSLIRVKIYFIIFQCKRILILFFFSFFFCFLIKRWREANVLRIFTSIIICFGIYKEHFSIYFSEWWVKQIEAKWNEMKNGRESERDSIKWKSIPFFFVDNSTYSVWSAVIYRVIFDKFHINSSACNTHRARDYLWISSELKKDAWKENPIKYQSMFYKQINIAHTSNCNCTLCAVNTKRFHFFFSSVKMNKQTSCLWLLNKIS